MLLKAPTRAVEALRPSMAAYGTLGTRWRGEVRAQRRALKDP